MHPKNTQRRDAPDITISSAMTGLPVVAPSKAPATALSGGFTTALGSRPQMAHPGSTLQGDAKLPPKQRAEESGVHPLRNTKHGAPTVPRKGHR